jgi:hypothetical protein
VGNPAPLILSSSLNPLICLERSRGTGLALLSPGDSCPNRLRGALRERSNELWGDGILSDIDCKVTLEKKT